ncbi:MAG: hypothetical protein ACK4K9_02700 [Bacteroidia bacterium]
MMCTEEFRSITITVIGAKLTDYYTQRESTGEIIRHTKDQIFESNTFVVLDDSYHKKLKNSSDKFWFKGFINDSLVVNEPLVIEADECHVNLFSGRTEVVM